MLQKIFRALRPRRRTTLSQARKLARAAIEALEQRRMLSVSASLNMSTHVLTVTGDSAANVIALQTSAGSLTITDHGSAVSGSPVTEADVTKIVVNAGSGADSITLNTSVNSIQS